MDEALFDRLRRLQPELAAIRHDIHAHPELGMEERRTAALVAEKLRGWGLEVTEGVGCFGVVGTLKGAQPGQRALGLRADMDALALQERTGLPHASTTPGVMHACGHDGHTTMLLGAAKYLAEHRDFGGTVHFIFQPAEEGRGGARAMLADGLFERFPVDAVYGLHNSPHDALGSFATRPGPLMAAADSWTVTFSGSGGHGGAAPHRATDVLVLQAQFVTALQTIVSRNVASADMAVLSLGHVQGGSPEALNVMPAQVTLGGTARTYDAAVRTLIERRLGEIADGLAATFGCRAETRYRRGIDAVINHAEQTALAVRAASALVGEANVDGASRPLTGAEDFAAMLEVRPGAFIFLGQGAGGATSQGVHTPTYDFNDDAIPYGVGYWVSLVQQEMRAE